MIHNSSFISNSRIKVLKYIVSLVVVMCAFGETIHLLNYVYFEEDEYERIKWHSFYEHSGEIETAFVGSSHVYFDIDPEMYTEMSGSKSFDLAGPLLRLSASYYTIKEAIRYNNLDRIYLELYYLPSTEGVDGTWEKDSYTNDWRTTDYMRTSINSIIAKLDLGISTEHYADMFLPFVRYREHLFDVEYMKETIAKKNSLDYINYKYHDEVDGIVEIRDMGYKYATKKLDEKDRFCMQERGITEERNLYPVAEEYLNRIIRLCKREGIELTFFISPIYPVQVASVENYDAYSRRISQIAEQNGIEFYDFNLIKTQFFDFANQDIYYDLGHLNSDGAKKFTKLFWKVVCSDNSDMYFEDSIENKWGNMESTFFGVYKKLCIENGECLFAFCIVDSNDKNLEYRIRMKQDCDECDRVMSDFSKNKEIHVNQDTESGILYIDVRDMFTNEISTYEIEYI